MLLASQLHPESQHADTHALPATMFLRRAVPALTKRAVFRPTVTVTRAFVTSVPRCTSARHPGEGEDV